MRHILKIRWRCIRSYTKVKLAIQPTQYILTHTPLGMEFYWPLKLRFSPSPCIVLSLRTQCTLCASCCCMQCIQRCVFDILLTCMVSCCSLRCAGRGWRVGSPDPIKLSNERARREFFNPSCSILSVAMEKHISRLLFLDTTKCPFGIRIVQSRRVFFCLFAHTIALFRDFTM